jgi:YHS domain-containing protein
LLLLFYLLFRLLIGKKGKGSPKESGGKDLPSQDILVEDPVCKVCVPKKQALTLQDNEKTIYFCSAECREKFKATAKGDDR